MNNIKEQIGDLFQKEIWVQEGYLEGKHEFLEGLDKILATQPTCTIEQRNFLNEIEIDQKRDINKNCNLLDMILDWLRAPVNIKGE